MSEYKPGDVVSGIVTGIEDYGIFLSFGDHCSGLIHISEITDSFVKDVSDYATLNSPMDAVILSYDSNNHYKLSVKSLNHTSKQIDNEEITETNTGFETLSNKLETWINETMNEIDKKNKKT